LFEAVNHYRISRIYKLEFYELKWQVSDVYIAEERLHRDIDQQSRVICVQVTYVSPSEE